MKEPSKDIDDVHEMNFAGYFKVNCNFHSSKNVVKDKKASLTILKCDGSDTTIIAKEEILLN